MEHLGADPNVRLFHAIDGMLQQGQQWLRRLVDRWLPAPPPAWPVPEPTSEPKVELEPISRLLLTDSVSRTLFFQYAEHRATDRREEETGWVLLGLRLVNEALALAALPAGAGREAGVAHVRFNAEAQALASRILRQQDRRLTILGIVHTHPGSLRHPSGGDYDGDQKWVRLLRGGEGVFAIGTADGPTANHSELVADQPKPSVQTFLGLRFSWFALGAGDARYRPLPVQLVLGPDLAEPLIPLWPLIEGHAEHLDRLCKQLAQVRFDLPAGEEPALQVSVPARKGTRLAVRLSGDDVRYGRLIREQWQALSEAEARPDLGLLKLLAEENRTEP